MRQRLSTILTHFTTRAPRRRTTESSERLAALTDQKQAILRITWWSWRHHYLEAKRRTLEARRDR